MQPKQFIVVHLNTETLFQVKMAQLQFGSLLEI